MKRRKTVQKKHKKIPLPWWAWLFRSKGSTSLSIVIVLGVIVAFAVMASGIFRTPIPPTPTTTSLASYTCCDSGDGEQCHPQGKIMQFTSPSYLGGNGGLQEYQLIKTNIRLSEGGNHMEPVGNGIYLNRTDSFKDFNDKKDECSHGDTNYDQLSTNNNTSCVPIPDDEIIYVCKSGDCTGNGKLQEKGDNSVYDAYFRVKDLTTPAFPGAPTGVPQAVKYCEKPQNYASASAQELTNLPNNGKRDNLQLETFGVKQSQVVTDWLSPYCKPALYLYPQEKIQVHVDLNPQGKLTYTNPLYPATGWDVTAFPGGNILSNGKYYDYLYYEAEINDSAITAPSTGYVLTRDEVAAKLPIILQQLGLNEKEKAEFVKYWVKVLPTSPYFFVGVMPQEELDALSPLMITPKPDKTIRVTLYFQALEKKISVQAPVITSVNRTGFTVVEWGGIFKRDKKHTFSCFI